MGMINPTQASVYLTGGAPFDLAWRENWYQPTSSSAADSWGTPAGGSAWTSTENTYVSATPSKLAYKTYTTASGSNGLGGVEALAADRYYSLGHYIQAMFSVSMNDLGNRRVYIGFADTTGTLMTTNDTPGQNYVCFRYSTPAGDSTWKCVSDNASRSPTVVDSGVTVTTGNLLFGIISRPDLGTVDFYINGFKKAGFTTTLPAASVASLNPIAYMRNVTAGTTRQLAVQYINIRFKAP